MNSAAPSLGTLILQRLESRRQSAVDFSRALRISDAAVHDLIYENPPRDPQLLEVVRAALDIDRPTWVDAAAAAICRIHPDRLRRTPRGALWVHLLERGIGLDQLATEIGVSARLIRLLATSGTFSGSLLKSPLLGLLGFKPDDPEITCALGQRHPSPKLRALIGRFLHGDQASASTLAREVGCSLSTAKLLIAGAAPRLFQFELAHQLARGLAIHLNEAADALADAQDPAAGSDSLRYQVAYWMYLQQKSPAYLSAKAKIPDAAIQRILSGRIPEDAQGFAGLRQILGIDPARWDRLVQREMPRRVMPTYEFSSYRGKVKSLQDMILDRAREEGVSATEWGARHGVNRFRIYSLIRQGKVPRRGEARVALCKALDLDRGAYEAAVRMMMAKARPHDSVLSTIVPLCGAQEAIIGLLTATGRTIRQISDETKIPATEVSLLVKRGVLKSPHRWTPALGKLLGMTPDELLEALKPRSQGPGEDEVLDDEVALLAVYRRLTPSQRTAAIEHLRGYEQDRAVANSGA